MSVEVRNLQSGEMFQVGPEGAIIGRVGGGASIQVEDRSVSKKHARIFTDGSQWFLEDMGSVNGTVVEGNKIGGAVPLMPGLVFSLSKHRFEIVRAPGGRGPVVPPEQETRTAMRQNARDLPSDLRKDPIPPRRKQAPPKAAEDEDIAPLPPENTNRGNNLPLASDQDFPSGSLGSIGAGSLDGVGPGEPALGINQFEELSPGEALAKGIGYFLKTVPLLALNPPGTVRSQIERPPLPALEKIPLAALLFPALAGTVLVQSGAGAVAAAIGGAFSVVAFIIAPVSAIIGGAIGAIISGFVSHPILNWIITKLGGTSDARSRTTHVAMGVATSVVMLIPNVLTVLLTAIIAKLATIAAAFSLLMIVPALITLVATPLPMFVQWQWWKSYGVAKWFQTLLLVFTVLSLLGGIAGCIGAISGAVTAMRAGGGTAVTTPDTPTPDTPTPDTPTPDTPTPDKPVTTTPDKPVTTTPDKPVTTTTTTPVTTTTTPDKPVVDVGNVQGINEKYATYARKRAEIEAVLERDPTLLRRTQGAERIYEQILERAERAEEDALPPPRKRKSALRPLYEKKKNAAVFEATSAFVDDLHRKLLGK